MKRKAFVPPSRLGGDHTSTAAQTTAAGAAPPLAVSVFDCLFSKKGRGASEGTLVLRGSKAQLLDLQLREKAADSLPTAVAAALHAAHAAALAAAAAGGPLWQEEEEPPQIALGQWQVEIEDDAAAAVSEAEWVLRQQVGAAAHAKGGKPTDAAGPAIPLDSLGARMLSSMGWRPAQGLGRAPGARTTPVLPQLKWDKGGLGASTHVKRLGPQATTFRRASAPAGSAGAAAQGGALLAAADCGSASQMAGTAVATSAEA
ncbi:hypothetical protein ABPG75_013399 [Micractinium tetrahymenae]